MPNNVFHISKLHCTPNKVEPSQEADYYGPSDGYTFWRVFIDDQLLTDFAQPFTRYDSSIELFGNIKVPIWGDGSGYVSVRQLGQYVIWSRYLTETEVYHGNSGLPDDKFIVFDLVEYGETLTSLSVPSPFITSRTPKTSLPQLTPMELYYLIGSSLPEDDLPLYRIPESSNDGRGVKLLRRIKAALENSNANIFAVTPPSSWLEVRIGLDVREFKECVWYVAKTSQGYAVLFASNPYFPLWISSAELNSALSTSID